MPDTAQSIADRLHEEGSRVVDFFNSLSDEQWGNLVYQHGSEWTMHHVLAHFASAERGRLELIWDVSTGGQGAPDGFDIDAFNFSEVQRLLGQSNHSLLELFTQERSRLVALVSSLQATHLERVGNDPFLGQVPLVDMIKLTYRHLQIHLRDMRRCL